jgi:hypothetical protein
MKFPYYKCVKKIVDIYKIIINLFQMDKKFALGMTVLTLTMLAVSYLPQNSGHALITKD